MVRQNEDDPIYFVLSWQVDAVALVYGILYHMFHVSLSLCVAINSRLGFKINIETKLKRISQDVKFTNYLSSLTAFYISISFENIFLVDVFVYRKDILSPMNLRFYFPH